MASKRMIAKMIIDSDVFLDMPQSAQNLYFHLNLRADDEGFIDNPKKIMRIVGSSSDDLKLLLAKRYLLSFESGVVVIKHWKLHNCIRKDRIKETVYQEEKLLLSEKPNGAYTDNKSFTAKEIDDCQTDDGQVTDKCPHRLDQYSIDKINTETATPPPAAVVKNPKQFDELEIHWLKIITAIQPQATWGNKGKEVGQLKNLSSNTKSLFKVGTPYESITDLADDLLKTFLEMREFGHWKAKDKPVIPSSLITAWSEITTTLAESYRQTSTEAQEVDW